MIGLYRLQNNSGKTDGVGWRAPAWYSDSVKGQKNIYKRSAQGYTIFWQTLNF